MTALIAFSAAAPAPAQNPTQCGETGVGPLCFPDLTAPNVIGDSNLNGQPDDGPRVFTIGATACNTGTNPLKDLLRLRGSGTTKEGGNFPITGLRSAALPPGDHHRLVLVRGSRGLLTLA